MTKRALVDHPASTKVYDVVAVGADFSVASPLYFTNCGDSVTANYTYDGSNFTAPAVDYDELRARKQKELDAFYDVDILADGAEYTLRRFGLRSDDLDRWQALYALARSAYGPMASFQITGGTTSPGVNKISNITLNAVPIINAAVDFDTGTAVTATAVAKAINDYASSPNYFAAAASDIVYIWPAKGTNFITNNLTLSVTVAGDVTVGSVTNLTGGLAPIYDWPVEADMLSVRSIEGFDIPMYTPKTALDFCNDVLEYFFLVSSVYREKTDEISALPNNEATIAAYDVEDGWPPG